MPVGKTKDVGWEIGVSRNVPCTPEEAWRLLTSAKGLGIWLGQGAELEREKGSPYRTADGARGEVRSFRPLDRIRLTWQREGWSHDSTVQAAISQPARSARQPDRGPSTTIRFHQERLSDVSERERQRDHWRSVLDHLEETLGPSR